MSCQHELVPIAKSKANELIKKLHRHHEPSANMSHVIGLTCNGKIIGAAVIGRPVSRVFDDGWTGEVTRCVVKEGHPTGCSMLYGACWRAAKALGYRKLITYTLMSESGASLRAVGWILTEKVGGYTWSRENRPREDKAPLERKNRWEISTTIPYYDYKDLFVKEEGEEGEEEYW